MNNIKKISIEPNQIDLNEDDILKDLNILSRV
jgi:hypothetical protein